MRAACGIRQRSLRNTFLAFVLCQIAALIHPADQQACARCKANTVSGICHMLITSLENGSLKVNMTYLQQALRQIGHILDRLESFVNTQKTVLLLRLAGSKARTVAKKMAQKTATGAWMIIPRTNTKTWFQVVDVLTYLGVRISVHRFSNQSSVFSRGNIFPLGIGVTFANVCPRILQPWSWQLRNYAGQ